MISHNVPTLEVSDKLDHFHSLSTKLSTVQMSNIAYHLIRIANMVSQLHLSRYSLIISCGLLNWRFVLKGYWLFPLIQPQKMTTPIMLL